MTCVIEVKQVPVTEMAGAELASATRGLGASLALLVVLADRHAPLDREHLRRQAIADHGVPLEVAESVRELVGAVAIYSATPVAIVADHLPRRYAARLGEHEVGSEALASTPVSAQDRVSLKARPLVAIQQALRRRIMSLSGLTSPPSHA